MDSIGIAISTFNRPHVLDLSLFATGRKIMYLWYTQSSPRQGAIFFLFYTKKHFAFHFPVRKIEIKKKSKKKSHICC